MEFDNIGMVPKLLKEHNLTERPLERKQCTGVNTVRSVYKVQTHTYIHVLQELYIKKKHKQAKLQSFPHGVILDLNLILSNQIIGNKMCIKTENILKIINIIVLKLNSITGTDKQRGRCVNPIGLIYLPVHLSGFEMHQISFSGQPPLLSFGPLLSIQFHMPRIK